MSGFTMLAISSSAFLPSFLAISASVIVHPAVRKDIQEFFGEFSPLRARTGRPGLFFGSPRAVGPCTAALGIWLVNAPARVPAREANDRGQDNDAVPQLPCAARSISTGSHAGHTDARFASSRTAVLPPSSVADHDLSRCTKVAYVTFYH